MLDNSGIAPALVAINVIVIVVIVISIARLNWSILTGRQLRPFGEVFKIVKYHRAFLKIKKLMPCKCWIKYEWRGGEWHWMVTMHRADASHEQMIALQEGFAELATDYGMRT